MALETGQVYASWMHGVLLVLLGFLFLTAETQTGNRPLLSVFERQAMKEERDWGNHLVQLAGPTSQEIRTKSDTVRVPHSSGWRCRQSSSLVGPLKMMEGLFGSCEVRMSTGVVNLMKRVQDVRYFLGEERDEVVGCWREVSYEFEMEWGSSDGLNLHSSHLRD